MIYNYYYILKNKITFLKNLLIIIIDIVILKYIYIYIYLNRDDFHWLTTYNDKYRNPTYKNKKSNINTVEEDGYTRGIKYIWDPSLHKKEVITNLI